MQDPSCVCDLHHSSGHCQVLNPPSEIRDLTCILMDTDWVLNLLSDNRNSHKSELLNCGVVTQWNIRQQWERVWHSAMWVNLTKCWITDTWPKRIHAVLFYAYKVQNQAKPSLGGEVRITVYLWQSQWYQHSLKEASGTFLFDFYCSFRNIRLIMNNVLFWWHL